MKIRHLLGEQGLLLVWLARLFARAAASLVVVGTRVQMWGFFPGQVESVTCELRMDLSVQHVDGTTIKGKASHE